MVDGQPTGPQTTGNNIKGNFIGTDANGVTQLGNGLDGIRIALGASNMAINSNNVISGNVVNGVEISGTASDPQTSGVTVAGNLIGTDLSGKNPLGNGHDGVKIDTAAQNNTIGGTATGDRNTISGNTFDGVEITGTSTGPQTSGNMVEGNFIGTDTTGTAKLAISQNSGVEIDGGAKGNKIGGTSIGAGNVVSGNLNGVVINGSTRNVPLTNSNLVEGNFIGTDPTGTQNVGNSFAGVFIGAGAFNNTIGGSIPAAGNVIAFNGSTGVGVGFGSFDTTTTNNLIRLNSIFSNGGLGIDLGLDGVTSNAPGIRQGPNDLQNFPVLVSAVVKTTAAGTFTTVQGMINSVPNTQLIIDFYSTPTLGPGASAQGKTYLGSLGVTTDGSGNATFLDELNAAVPGGQFITATASTTLFAPNGDTSEFSPPVQVVQVAPPDTTPPTATLTSDPTIKAKTTAPYAFTITYSDNVAVNAATIPPATVTVTGPNGFSEQATLTSTNLSNGATVVASYTIPAPSGGFTHDLNGVYTVSVSPNSVADTSGNLLAGGPVGMFAINIPARTHHASRLAEWVVRAGRFRLQSDRPGHERLGPLGTQRQLQQLRP